MLYGILRENIFLKVNITSRLIYDIDYCTHYEDKFVAFINDAIKVNFIATYVYYYDNEVGKED